MTIGILGLGKMGSRIARKLSFEHRVLVWNRSPEPVQEFLKSAPQAKSSPTIEELVKNLPNPRIVWLMLPAGDATETVFSQVLALAAPDDIIIDGGNSNFKDTQRRYETCKTKGIRFLGVGISGGILAEKNGFPQMVGGERRAYDVVTPILDSLAKPNGGHAYFGSGGAGHFVKMVHNGIEYGLMQSLGEGFDVLSKSPYSLDLIAVAKLWQKGTLVSGFMLDRVVEALPKTQEAVGVIAESGEAKWTVEQAKAEGVDVEIIEAALNYRIRSQTDPKIQQSFTAKLVAALRNAFGGHEVKKK